MKPKILFILHLPPPVHGAALMGSYVKASAKINDSFECSFINLSASKSIETIGKLGTKKALFFIQLLLSTIKALVKKKYDLCYVTITSNGTAFYKDFLVVTILKIFRKKILLHFHNKGVEKGTQVNKINYYLYKFVLGGKKTRVVLLSPNLYADIKQFVDQKRVYYCANGINPYNGILPEKKATSPVRILFLSNMMVAKGVFVLLEACSQLRNKNISFECHFVGDWLDITESSFFEKVKELNLSDYVFAHGKKYDQEKNFYYQQTDIFVFPTLDEAFGLVLLEAMQFELPVVASDEGGIPDIVIDNKTGYIVPKNNPGELAVKLVSLISDPSLRQTMGLAGKKRFEENYTLNQFEENITRIMSEFAGAA
ncbi:MAG TPA: glycosyltransferase family 4 protein [Chitinophagaceae bacterium]|nr:glycosyltransferase family 4 protein [Chitinophagaceae bacterium]